MLCDINYRGRNRTMRYHTELVEVLSKCPNFSRDLAASFALAFFHDLPLATHS